MFSPREEEEYQKVCEHGERRLFPEAPEQLLDSVLGCLPTGGKSSCWNRHKRRRGAFVHVFAGESKDSFTKCAHELGLEHISIDIKEDLCLQIPMGFYCR